MSPASFSFEPQRIYRLGQIRATASPCDSLAPEFPRAAPLHRSPRAMQQASLDARSAGRATQTPERSSPHQSRKASRKVSPHGHRRRFHQISPQRHSHISQIDAQNKKASRINEACRRCPFSRRASASTGFGIVPDFRPSRAQLQAKLLRRFTQRRPITVAGPWPIFTAFQFPRASSIFHRKCMPRVSQCQMRRWNIHWTKKNPWG